MSYTDYVLGMMDENGFLDMVSQSPEVAWDALVKLFSDALDCGTESGK